MHDQLPSPTRLISLIYVYQGSILSATICYTMSYRLMLFSFFVGCIQLLTGSFMGFKALMDRQTKGALTACIQTASCLLVLFALVLAQMLACTDASSCAA